MEKEDWYYRTLHKSQKHSTSSAGSKRACLSRLHKWWRKEERKMTFDHLPSEIKDQGYGYILCRRTPHRRL